ncbi:MAG TPA: Ig domain-containing protein [Anaerolineales bacterium]|nr:Ig domain-containing protein [Anaerolineales bacterium]
MKNTRFAIHLFAVVLFLAMTSCSIFSPTRPALKFDPDTLPDAQVGRPYEVEIKVTDNVTPVFQFGVSEGTLPKGLTIEQKEHEDVARIFGTPGVAGTFTFKVQALCFGTNVSGQSGEQEYTIVVK